MNHPVPPALPPKDAPTPPPPPARHHLGNVTRVEQRLIEAAVALFYSPGDIGLPTPMENLSAAVEDYIRTLTREAV